LTTGRGAEAEGPGGGGGEPGGGPAGGPRGAIAAPWHRRSEAGNRAAGMAFALAPAVEASFPQRRRPGGAERPHHPVGESRVCGPGRGTRPNPLRKVARRIVRRRRRRFPPRYVGRRAVPGGRALPRRDETPRRCGGCGPDTGCRCSGATRPARAVESEGVLQAPTWCESLLVSGDDPGRGTPRPEQELVTRSLLTLLYLHAPINL